MAESFFWVWSVGGRAVVALPHEVDMQNAAELRRILAAVSINHEVVLIDLSQTSLCDCTGLGVLLGGLHDARVSGRELRLVVGCPALLRTSTLAGLAGLFSIYRTVAEALASSAHSAAARQPSPASWSRTCLGSEVEAGPAAQTAGQ